MPPMDDDPNTLDESARALVELFSSRPAKEPQATTPEVRLDGNLISSATATTCTSELSAGRNPGGAGSGLVLSGGSQTSTSASHLGG
jgi:hypothetical protein